MANAELVVRQRYFEIKGDNFIDRGGSLPSEQGSEKFSWKKLLMHLGLIVAGGAVGWAAGGVMADSVNWSIGTHPIGKGVFQFVGGMIGMFAGGLTAELSTAKMPGRVYL